MSNKPRDRTLRLKKARTKKREGTPVSNNPVARFSPLFNKARRFIDKKKKLKNDPPPVVIEEESIDD